MTEEILPPTMRGISSGTPTGGNHMDSGSIPPWVGYILDQMDKRFTIQDQKLDRLVTRDAFREEQSRVNDLIRELSKDTTKNTADIQAEATARTNSEIARTARERDDTQRQQATERQTRWQWFAIPAAAVAGYVVPWIAGGGMSQP